MTHVEDCLLKRKISTHKVTHTTCGKLFNTVIDLSKHKLTHSKCDICGKLFKTSKDLNTHKLTHTT